MISLLDAERHRYQATRRRHTRFDRREKVYSKLSVLLRAEEGSVFPPVVVANDYQLVVDVRKPIER